MLKTKPSKVSSDDSVILVTGASGFVGVNIVKYLAERGRKVLGTIRDADGPDPLVRNYLEGLEDYIEWVKVDLREHQKVMYIADNHKINGIIHAAVLTANEEDEQTRTREIVDSNLMGTVNTLELAKKNLIRRFVYVSSSVVYSTTPIIGVPIKEESHRPYLDSRGLYWITKIAGENLTQRYGQLFPMKTICMRITAPYGPMERPTKSRNIMGQIGELLKLLLKKRFRKIRVKGLSYYNKDWTYVMDVAQGLVAGLDVPELLHSIYNISCGINYSLTEILSALKEALGIDFDWEAVEKEEEADFVASTSGLRDPLSIEKAKKELGFSPQYDLKQGIKEYVEWMRDFSKKGTMVE